MKKSGTGGFPRHLVGQIGSTAVLHCPYLGVADLGRKMSRDLLAQLENPYPEPR